MGFSNYVLAKAFSMYFFSVVFHDDTTQSYSE